MASKLAQLKDLGALKEQGVLTQAEFEEQKTKILSSRRRNAREQNIKNDWTTVF